MSITSRSAILPLTLLMSAAIVAQQPAQTPGAAGPAGLTTAQIAKPSSDSWPTYNGDYSGRRFSPLNRIDTTNVSSMVPW